MNLVINTLSDAKLIELLQNGNVGVLPTDTVYGLVCVARNPDAVKRLYNLKSREHKPGTVIAAHTRQLIDLGIKARYLKAVEQFWPNPISIIIPAGQALNYLHQDVGGLACRVIVGPQNLLNLLRISGPLLTSSANLPGQPNANSIAEAQQYFDDRVDFYVDGGELPNHKPSTVIRMVDDAVEVLREGAVKIDEQTGKVLQ